MEKECVWKLQREIPEWEKQREWKGNHLAKNTVATIL